MQITSKASTGAIFWTIIALLFSCFFSMAINSFLGIPNEVRGVATALSMIGTCVLIASRTIKGYHKKDVDAGIQAVKDKEFAEKITSVSVSKAKEAIEQLKAIEEALQKEREEAQVIADELTTVRQDLTAANAKLATANTELATAQESLTVAEKESTTVIAELATVNSKLATVKQELATANNKLELLPLYEAFFASFCANRDATSAVNRREGSEEDKAKASEVKRLAKIQLEEGFNRLIEAV